LNDTVRSGLSARPQNTNDGDSGLVSHANSPWNFFMGKSIEKHDRLYRIGLPMVPEIDFLEEPIHPAFTSFEFG
jgi:hypothetical protein